MNYSRQTEKSELEIGTKAVNSIFEDMPKKLLDNLKH